MLIKKKEKYFKIYWWLIFPIIIIVWLALIASQAHADSWIYQDLGVTQYLVMDSSGANTCLTGTIMYITPTVSAYATQVLVGAQGNGSGYVNYGYWNPQDPAMHVSLELMATSSVATTTSADTVASYDNYGHYLMDFVFPTSSLPYLEAGKVYPFCYNYISGGTAQYAFHYVAPIYNGTVTVLGNPYVPPADSVSITYPESTSTPIANFSNFLLNYNTATTTGSGVDTYEIYMDVGTSSSSLNYGGLQFVNGTGNNSSSTASVPNWQYLNSAQPYYAMAELRYLPNSNNLNVYSVVATSSLVSFNVSYSEGILYATSSLTGTPYTIATSTYTEASTTCSGGLACTFGNIATDVLNFLFGINSDLIQTVSGINLTTTPPFNVIPIILENINSISSSTPAFATTTASVNIGGISSMEFSIMSPQTIYEFLSQSVIGMIRGLLVATLYLLFITGIYIQIKNLFKHTK